MHKYKVSRIEERTTADGLVFDSANEMKRYLFLKEKEEAGQIFDLELQPLYDLKGPDGSLICRYRADFKYLENNALVVEDYKGAITPEFRLKRKLWASNFPDQPLSVIGWDNLKIHRCFRDYDDIHADLLKRRRIKRKAANDNKKESKE